MHTSHGLIAGLALATATIVAWPGTAGATDAPTLDHRVVVLFNATDSHNQIPIVVEPAPDEPLAGWERMVALVAGACSTDIVQADIFGPGSPVPVVGTLYPPDTPGAESGLGPIPGGTDCGEAPPVAPPVVPPVVPPVAPPPAPEAPVAPPAPAAPVAPSPAPEAPEVVPVTLEVAAPAPEAAAVAPPAAVSANAGALPVTGSSSTPWLAGTAAALMAAGAAVLTSARRLARR